MPDTPDDNPFLRYRAIVESVIRFVARRRGLRGEDAADFAGDVRLRLVQDNYDVFRKFQGRSSPQTYLTVVITRSALDYRAAQWGRWRPSARARRAGPQAVLLERLVERDGMSVPEALAIVEREFGQIDRAALEAFAETLVPRVRRQEVGEESLSEIADPSRDPERELLRSERAALIKRAYALLERFIAELPPDDRKVMQLLYEGMKVADIARLLQLEAKPLYRRIEDLKAQLKKRLKDEGIDDSVAHDMLGDD